MEKKGPATYDPGWNDPPMFSYESQSSQSKASKPRTFLNKRVAFPLQASPTTGSSSGVVDPTAPLPPCSLSSLPPPPASSVTQPKENRENHTSSEDFDPKQALNTVMNNLLFQLNSHEFEEKLKTDIKRRLDTLEKMWSDGKLSRDVQKRLLELAEAVRREDGDKADDLQKGLMVDHAAACSSWMSGVRHLIHHKLTLTPAD